MEIAAEILARDQARQSMLHRGFDFAAILAQFRRYPIETQSAIDLLFGATGD